MATFAPTVPDQTDPRYYLHLAKPIETPHFANATSETLQTAGKMIEGSVKAVAPILEKTGENIGSDPAKAKRDELTSNLDTTLNTLQYGKPDSSQEISQDQAKSLFEKTGGWPMGAGKTPAELQQLPRQLQGMESAKANGKISLTQYYGEMDKLASDLRSKYSWSPAIKNGIDAAFAKVTGGDPANLQIHSMLSDINSYLGGKDKEKNDFFQLLKSHPAGDIPGGWDKLYDDVNSGRKTVQQGMSILAPYVSRKYDMEMNDLQFKNQQNMKTVDLDKAKRSAAEHSINTNFNMQMGFNLNGPGDWTPAKVNQWYEDVRLGKKKLDPEQLEGFGNIHLIWADKAEADFRRRMAENGADKILGTELMQQYASEVRKPWEQQAEMWKNGKFGLAAGYKQLLDSMHAYNGIKLFTSKEVGQSAALLSGARAAFGDNVAQSFFDRNVIPSLQGGIKDLSDAMKKRSEYEVMQLVSPALPGVETSDSFSKAVDSISSIGKSQGVDTTKPAPEIAIPLKEIRGLITDPQYGIIAPNLPKETGDNIIYKAFNPKNFGMLAKMTSDQKRADGTTVDGKEAWFWSWTRPDVAQRVAQSPHMQLYKDWALRSFEQEIAPQALQDLASMQMEGKNFKVEYDSAEGKGDRPPRLYLTVEGKEWKAGGPTERAGIRRREVGHELAQAANYNYISSVLSRINKGLDGYYQVSKASGSPDIDADVITSLQHGFQGAKGDVSELAKIGHLPSKVLMAIISSRQQQEENKTKNQDRLPPKE